MILPHEKGARRKKSLACFSLFFHHLAPPFCLSLGVVSQQDNSKTFSVSSTIRIPVERKDNGAALSCEATHPSLGIQRRIRHYRLDVYCESLLLFRRNAFYVHTSHQNIPHPSRKQMKYRNVNGQIFQKRKLFHLY